MNQKFWHLTSPDSTKGLVTWSDNVDVEGIKCPITSTHDRRGKRITDLDVLLTSKHIKDFMWTWINECLIQDNILSQFKDQGFSGFDVKPVSVGIKFKSKEYDPCDDNPGIKTKDAVQIEIPKLWELVITGWSGIAPPESGIRLWRRCIMCGLLKYKGDTNPLLLIDEKQWDGSDFFMVWPYPRYIFITDRAAKFIKEKKLSGVRLQRIEDLNLNGGAMPGRLSYYMPDDRAYQIGEPLGIY